MDQIRMKITPSLIFFVSFKKEGGDLMMYFDLIEYLYDYI